MNAWMRLVWLVSPRLRAVGLVTLYLLLVVGVGALAAKLALLLPD